MDEHDVFHDSSSSDIRTATLASCDPRDAIIEPRYTYYSSLGACFLYRKEVWQNLKGYDETRHGSEDYDFWIRASHQFKLGRIPWEEAPMYAYRVHSNSMSSTVPHCYTKARVQILKREVRLHPGDLYLKSALAYFREQAPKEGLRKTLWSLVEPMYARSLQLVPTRVKQRARSVLRSSKRLFSEPTR